MYGYSLTQGTDGGNFFFRSRSCREDGKILKEGVYKASEHELASGRHAQNLDLLFSDGSVLLLSLRPAGAGFPRRVPGFQGSLE